MAKYICHECTGRSGEDHIFETETPPDTCPWCGSPEYVMTYTEYLEKKLEDTQWDVEHYKEQAEEAKRELKEIESLAVDLALDGWSDEQLQEFLEHFGLDE